jgi:hypothetical protein
MAPGEGSTLVSSILACKYWTGVEVTDSGKHSNLLHYGKFYFVKSFMVQATVYFHIRFEVLITKLLMSF